MPKWARRVTIRHDPDMENLVYRVLTAAANSERVERHHAIRERTVPPQTLEQGRWSNDMALSNARMKVDGTEGALLHALKEWYRHQLTSHGQEPLQHLPFRYFPPQRLQTAIDALVRDGKRYGKRTPTRGDVIPRDDVRAAVKQLKTKIVKTDHKTKNTGRPRRVTSRLGRPAWRYEGLGRPR